MRGARVIYKCADDTHGTAIMIRARQEGRSEEALIRDMNAAHRRDFAGFQIAFDHYGSTNSERNREYCAEIWSALRKNDFVAEREVTQLFDARRASSWPTASSRGLVPSAVRPRSIRRFLRSLRQHL